MILHVVLVFVILSGLSLPQSPDVNDQFYNTWLRYEYYKDIEQGKTPLECMKMEDYMQLYFLPDKDLILIGSLIEGVTRKFFARNYDTLIIYDINNEDQVEFVLLYLIMELNRDC